MTRPLGWAAILFVLGAPSPIAAEVVDSARDGFTVRTTVTIAATGDAAFRALVEEIGTWWDPEHTYSGRATNLRLDPVPGGCFCETLAGGGGVQHAVVVNVVPGELLRLRGALGPLQGAGTAGVLTWQFSAQPGGGVTADVTYVVGGYYPGGLDAVAAAVDSVIGDQLRRLKAYLERDRR
jgi:uncharacterized protein YndB with AHSA1/START domain